MFHYSHPNAFYQPHLHPRGCSREYLLGLGCQGCSGACSTPFSRLLQPSVRSVVDLEVMTFGRPLSHILRFVGVSHFQLESIPSVLLSVSQGDWLASFDLREAYIPVTVHLLLVPFFASCYVTRSTSSKLCFGLSTALPVFTWVMAPVSAILHSLGIRMRRYLDTWLVQSSSQESLLEVLLPVLRLCPVFGIVILPRYSNLIPSQVVQCLWVVFDSTSFRASPSVERISRRQSATAVFMSCA